MLLREPLNAVYDSHRPELAWIDEMDRNWKDRCYKERTKEWNVATDGENPICKEWSWNVCELAIEKMTRPCDVGSDNGMEKAHLLQLDRPGWSHILIKVYIGLGKLLI